MEMDFTALAGVMVFVPTPYRDERGFFTRTFDAEVVRAAGIEPNSFTQDSQSRSVAGVLRGLHTRLGAGEAKLIRVAHGSVFDVVVDARLGSATFGQSWSTVLDDQAHHQLYVPPGLLHGHLTLSPTADVCYRIDRPHDPGEDASVHYADPDLAIEWPREPSLLSDKDQRAGSWADFVARLPPYMGGG